MKLRWKNMDIPDDDFLLLIPGLAPSYVFTVLATPEDEIIHTRDSAGPEGEPVSLDFEDGTDISQCKVHIEQAWGWDTEPFDSRSCKLRPAALVQTVSPSKIYVHVLNSLL
jgi:hypothetical protein